MANIIISLPSETAEWLRAIMQNPINCANPAGEDQADLCYRTEIFEALVTVLPIYRPFNFPEFDDDIPF